MMKWFKKLVAPEQKFEPGQRVRLVAEYPSDIADTAHRGPVYGTVQAIEPRTKYGDHILVLFDGFPDVRYMTARSISSIPPPP